MVLKRRSMTRVIQIDYFEMFRPIKRWQKVNLVGYTAPTLRGNQRTRSIVGYTGFEPVTSALSRQRSKPTELITQKQMAKVKLILD